MNEALQPGLTKFLYDADELASLSGAVSVPTGTRVEVGRTDYIVDTVRLSVRAPVFDIYYECHMAEETGSRVSPV